MGSHTHGKEHHKTVAKAGAHLVAERVALDGLVGSSEEEYKVALQNGGLLKVGVERN